MCTLSWITFDEGYEIFFNRDELRSRLKATAPEKVQHDEATYIAPFDQDAGGTWISANQFGLSLCLLNNYCAASTLVPKNRISRGLLVKQLATVACTSELIAKLNSVDLSCYQPFDLLVFELQQSPTLLAWDGVSLNQKNNLKMPITSSSFKFSEVAKSRQRQFDCDEFLSKDILLKLHAGHQPERGPHSVCMHREDASTVSFSHIKVNKSKVSFEYQDGSPCEAGPKMSVGISVELRQIPESNVA